VTTAIIQGPEEALERWHRSRSPRSTAVEAIGAARRQSRSTAELQRQTQSPSIVQPLPQQFMHVPRAGAAGTD